MPAGSRNFQSTFDIFLTADICRSHIDHNLLARPVVTKRPQGRFNSLLILLYGNVRQSYKEKTDPALRGKLRDEPELSGAHRRQSGNKRKKIKVKGEKEE
jgi:hypothetical protein